MRNDRFDNFNSERDIPSTDARGAWHNYRDHLSKKLLPDDAIYVIVNNTIFIIELKFQKTAGSVDEKLQTCDFKKKQYRKLLAPLNFEVEYVYILNDWFRQPEYKDVLDYVISVGCQYYFHYLPLQKLGLPVPDEDRRCAFADGGVANAWGSPRVALGVLYP